MTRDVTGNSGKISVLWDLVDFPVPEGRSIREIIGSVLAREGYTGDVSITAYGETNPYLAEDGFTFVQKSDKYWRLNKMLVDICYWALDRPAPPYRKPSTLMVVAKNMDKETEFVHLLQNVKASDFNVLLVVPDDCLPEVLPIPNVNLAWYWNSLLEGGEPMPRIKLQALLLRVKQASCNVW